MADCVYFTDKEMVKVNKYKYACVVIDCWSRAIWVQPLKSLVCNNIVEFFTELFKSTQKPVKLCTDQVLFLFLTCL